MIRECRHIKDDGKRCHSPALKDQPYCYFHIKLIRMHRMSHIELPPIEDSTSVLLAIGQVIRVLNYETMDTKRAGLMLYGLQIASSITARQQPSQPADHVRSVHNIEGDTLDFHQALVRDVDVLAPESTVCEPSDCPTCTQKPTCQQHQQPQMANIQPPPIETTRDLQVEPAHNGGSRGLKASENESDQSPWALAPEQSTEPGLCSNALAPEQSTEDELCNNGTVSAGPSTEKKEPALQPPHHDKSTLNYELQTMNFEPWLPLAPLADPSRRSLGGGGSLHVSGPVAP